jgi:Ca2+-binding RTX toxin-like protein
MHGRTNLLALAGALLALGAIGAPVASAACPAPDCLTPGAPSPEDRVVVRWRVTTAAKQTGLQLTTVQQTNGGSATVTIATSDPVTTEAGTTREVAARLALPKRGTVTLTGGSGTPTVEADTEPDADGDGYGDRTQDACPGNAVDHAAPCSAVRTFGSPLHLVPDPVGQPSSLAPKAGVQTTPETFTAPIDGVITRWRVRAAPRGHALKLQVLRGTGAAPTVVASAAALTPADTGVITTPTQLAVRAGDRLGVSSTGDLDTLAPMPDETIALYDPAGGPHAFRLLVQADVEPDADGDGKGDLTQDRADLRLTADGAHRYTVTNLGPDRALDVVLRGSAPFCPPAATCALGTLAPGASATVDASPVLPALLTPEAQGYTTSATVEATTTDPDRSNNTASVTTTLPGYTPPPVSPPPAPKACGNTIRGTRDDDALRGTAFGDRIVAGDGADFVKALAGDDCLSGGAGVDVLDAGDGADRLDGSTGSDRMFGGAGDDRLVGGRGNDRLIGGPGDDTLAPGLGRDSVSGGGGNDTINARDGLRETIDCGAGRDTVRADRSDRLKGCERVTRR